jgi:glucose-6-phosphate isomerase
VPELLRAAIAGTNQAYADDRRPTADIHVPVLNEFAMGELFQFFMLATALEGRLIGINPYGQPGVEAYKRNMKAVLKA